MMFGSLNDNKMLCEAREQGRSVSPFAQILTFFVMHIVITFVMQLALTPVIYVRLVFDEEFVNLASAGDFDAVIRWLSEFTANMPEYIRIISIFLYALFFAVAVFYCLRIIKRSFPSMGFRSGVVAKELFLGAAFAAIFAALVLGAETALGAVGFSGVKNANPLVIVAYFFAFAVQGFAEETFVRGCFMVNSVKDSSVFYALVMSSMLFAYMHSAESGLGVLGYINSFLFGLLLGIYFLRRGSIWGIGAFRAIWNFIQCAVLGFNVNGATAGTSILGFKLGEGVERISGGVLGTENGLAFTLVCFLAIGAVMLMRPNKAEFVETAPADKKEVD